MKLRIHFQPALIVLLLGAAATFFFVVSLVLPAGWRIVSLLVALFYGILFGVSSWSLLRIAVLERWMNWDSPGRLLILSPHEDD